VFIAVGARGGVLTNGRGRLPGGSIILIFSIISTNQIGERQIDVTCHELKILLANFIFLFLSELKRKTRTVARTAACSESVNKQRKKNAEDNDD
jgi:hypothetical protein